MFANRFSPDLNYPGEADLGVSSHCWCLLKTRLAWGFLAWLVFVQLGCAGAPHPVSTSSRATDVSPARPEERAPKQLAATSDYDISRDAETRASQLNDFAACGQIGGQVDCQHFSSATEALQAVLVWDPLVLAVGEAHALKGSETVEPTVRRFGRELLPLLVTRGAKQLVVELLVPATNCETSVAAVREQEQPITAPQVATNQSDYVWLGTRTRELGLVPYVLEPSCEEFRIVAQAKDDPVFALLELVRNQAGAKIERFVRGNVSAGAPAGFVVAYGGALHNDAVPRSGREAWSFGPKLIELTAGRYIELDLVIPEYVKDSEPWTLLPWYEHFKRTPRHETVALYRHGEHSFTLVFADSIRTPQLSPVSD